MYEEFCDLEKDTCNWTPTPECSFAKQDLFIYDPVLMKHKKYCNYDEQGIICSVFSKKMNLQFLIMFQRERNTNYWIH